MSRNGKKGELRQSHRVLVVGGGPAGLASAITLAAAGVAVVVVEKGSWPLDKVCGEGIPPIGVDFLQRFDVLSCLQADMIRPFRGIRYRNPGGYSSRPISRGDLDWVYDGLPSVAPYSNRFATTPGGTAATHSAC